MLYVYSLLCSFGGGNGGDRKECQLLSLQDKIHLDINAQKNKTQLQTKREAKRKCKRNLDSQFLWSCTYLPKWPKPKSSHYYPLFLLPSPTTQTPTSNSKGFFYYLSSPTRSHFISPFHIKHKSTNHNIRSQFFLPFTRR